MSAGRSSWIAAPDDAIRRQVESELFACPDVDETVIAVANTIEVRP